MNLWPNLLKKQQLIENRNLIQIRLPVYHKYQKFKLEMKFKISERIEDSFHLSFIVFLKSTTQNLKYERFKGNNT